ncbi:MAG: O-antigen ligase family protein [Solirubrobacteraceae bacterium]
MSAHAGPVDRRRPAVATPVSLGRVATVTGAWLAVGIGAVLSAICFGAGGGLALDSQVPVEMGLTLGGAALVVGALAVETRTAWSGAASIGLLFLLAAFTAASVIWSVAPDESWIEGSRTLAYAFTFLGAVALVRIAPERWTSVLVGVLLAGVAVSAYAVATRVFPGALSPDEIYARLREPFGYWNAVGLTAGLAVPPALWLGARRDGHGAVGAVAYPILVLLLVTLMLAYSRGALLALAVGLAFYFAAIPLRLRSLGVLLLGGVGAAAVVIWTFSKPALSADHIVLASRLNFGHLLGLLLVGVAMMTFAAGLALRFAAFRRPWPPALRRRGGVAVLVAVALVPVAGVAAVSASSRGLDGSVSHAWRALTDPHATTPPNDPSRLTAIGSVRARYWNDALKIARDHLVVGVGAGGYPTARAFYRSDTLEVQHAHGYVVQTLADLGLVGMALSLLFCAAWCVAATRAARPFGWGGGGRRRGEPGEPAGGTAEQVGLLVMISCVLVFAVHSLIDWTFFVPGDAAIALLCAGWVAGRGPAPLTSGRPSLAGLTRHPVRTMAAAGAAGLALVIAWSQWQPLRSQQAATTALAALARQDYAGARAAANTAIRRDPLSVDPLIDLATIETQAGLPKAARAALVRAVRLTPSDARPWEQLAGFDLSRGHRTRALRDLAPALYLDPQSHAGVSQYLDTLRGPGAAPATTLPAVPTAPASPAAPAGTT